MPCYNADGTIKTTVVNGLTRTGLYAADGSYNVVIDDVANKGTYHPCGAFRVSSTPNGQNHKDASGAFTSNHILGHQK